MVNLYFLSMQVNNSKNGQMAEWLYGYSCLTSEVGDPLISEVKTAWIIIR
jgi:hypothetical protein